MGQVTFFGQNDDVSSQGSQVSPIYHYPDELRLNTMHVAQLISSLRHETTAETDLLEKFTDFLTQIDPNNPEEKRTIQAYADILDTVAFLYEQENGYPSVLLNLLA